MSEEPRSENKRDRAPANHPLRMLLKEIHDLERRIAARIQGQQRKREFDSTSGKPVFGADARRRFQPFVKSISRFLWESSFLKILTAPLIYSLLFPLVLVDGFVLVYQVVCFPLYGIPQVRRRDYVVLDRHRLPYLNWIEKINCSYCGYANGVVALAREVASRTEQHWCPIKHARKVKGPHARQCLFCDYGDAESFRREFHQVRADFFDLRDRRRHGADQTNKEL